MSERTPISFSETEIEQMIVTIIDGSRVAGDEQLEWYWDEIDHEYKERGLTAEAYEDLTLEACRRLSVFRRAIGKGPESFDE